MCEVHCHCHFQAKFIRPASEPIKQEIKCGNIDFPQIGNNDTTCIKVPDDLVHHWQHMNVTILECNSIERSTSGQNNCPDWFKHRRNRLTASNFGRIMSRKTVPSDSFLLNLLRPKSFSSASTSYGSAQEPKAKEKFIEVKPSCHLHKCGFVISPDLSFMGATPDAKVCEAGVSGILEVKCPYSMRDLTIQEALAKNAPDFCLQINNDMITLKEDHPYSYQVQGQLLITGAPFCYFMVYTRVDCCILKVLPKKQIIKSLAERMINFYVDFAKPFFESHP